jgi:malic enzyme
MTNVYDRTISKYLSDGTAVVCLAAIINGLKLMKKQPGEVKLIINGAG